MLSNDELRRMLGDDLYDEILREIENGTFELPSIEEVAEIEAESQKNPMASPPEQDRRQWEHMKALIEESKG